MIEAVNSTDQ